MEKNPKMILYCLITEKEITNPLERVKIKRIDNISGQVDPIITSVEGDFRKTLPSARISDEISFYIVPEKEGYLTKTITYGKVLDKEGIYNIHEELDVSMSKIDTGMDLA